MNMQNIDKRVAQLLNEARVSKQLSIRQVAAKVGVAPSTIMRVEAADQKPSLFLVMQMCQALNISAARLVAKLEEDTPDHTQK